MSTNLTTDIRRALKDQRVSATVARLYAIDVAAALVLPYGGVLVVAPLLVVGTGWAVGSLRLGLKARIGFSAAVAGALVGSAAVLPSLLIGTQAMGTGQPGEMLAFVVLLAMTTAVLVVINGVAALATLAPLGFKDGIAGVVVGTALALPLLLVLGAASGPLAPLFPDTVWFLLRSCGLAAVLGLPVIGGVVSLGRRRFR